MLHSDIRHGGFAAEDDEGGAEAFRVVVGAVTCFKAVHKINAPVFVVEGIQMVVSEKNMGCAAELFYSVKKAGILRLRRRGLAESGGTGMPVRITKIILLHFPFYILNFREGDVEKQKAF